MEEGLTKKLKGSDGLPIPVGCDNPQSDVPQSFHDGAAAEFVRNQIRIETKSVDYYSSEPKGPRSYKLFSFNDGFFTVLLVCQFLGPAHQNLNGGL